MKLFIVGYGFDLLHKLPTAYSDFRQYLITKYPGADEYDELIPESIMMPDGKVRYEIDQVAGYISRIIDECDGGNWRNLESFLGTTIFENLLYDLDCVDMEMPEKETMRVIHRNAELSENMKQVFIKVKSLFCDWVREMLGNIDLVSIRRNDIAAVLAEGNAFLSFNYTYGTSKASESLNKVKGLKRRLGMLKAQQNETETDKEKWIIEFKKIVEEYSDLSNSAEVRDDLDFYYTIRSLCKKYGISAFRSTETIGKIDISNEDAIEELKGYIAENAPFMQWIHVVFLRIWHVMLYMAPVFIFLWGFIPVKRLFIKA